MWNKIISLLILVCVFGWFIWGYYYFFVLNKGSLLLQWNISDYRVEMYNHELRTTFSTICEFSECELIDLAPFSYQLRIIKEWYEEFQQSIRITKRSQQKFDFTLEKKVFLTFVDDSSQSVLENTDKIAQLQYLTQLRRKYKFFELPEKKYFYIEENSNNTLSLFHSEKQDILYTFETLPPKEIQLFPVYGSQYVLLSLGKQYVLIDIWKGTREILDFSQDLQYAKKDGNLIFLVNEKWTFLYDYTKKTTEYFYLFKDFVYLDQQHYVGIIFNTEATKKQNFGLQEISGNLIVKYNHFTKERKVVHATSMDIKKILKENHKIFLYDQAQKAYEIENID